MNKNTFTLKKKIMTPELPSFIPVIGDRLTFCETEDEALALFKELPDGDSGEVCLTDFFKLGEVQGTMYYPISIKGRFYGFFGRRKTEESTSEGDFFMYETEVR